MDNIWFYTLSTSAQVLAALAGLFAVFVVWKMQEFTKSLLEIRHAIINIISHLSANTKDYKKIELASLHAMVDSEILEKFSELLLIKIKDSNRISASQSIHSDNLISYSLDEFTEGIYKNKITKKISILNDLKKILIANFIVISVCIMALTFSGIICYKFIFLVFISVAVLYCLYLIGSGIYKITSQ